MSRIITQELAEKIRDKLCGKNAPSKGTKHDIYPVRYNEKVVGHVSIRRGSEKDQGHDFIPKGINVSMAFAKELGICTKSFEDYIDNLRGRGHIEPLKPGDIEVKQVDKPWEKEPWFVPKIVTDGSGE